MAVDEASRLGQLLKECPVRQPLPDGKQKIKSRTFCLAPLPQNRFEAEDIRKFVEEETTNEQLSLERCTEVAILA